MIHLLACAEPTLPATTPQAAVWVEDSQVESGQSVRVHAPEGAALAEVDGLTAQSESDGWTVSGPDASYVLSVTVPGVEAPVRMFVDIGVKGPTGGAMDDLAAIPEPPAPVWPWVVAAVAGGVLLAGGAVYAWLRLRPEPPPPPPLPPDVLARREWAALRARTDLGHETLALELSAVYRRYLEAVHQWPATQRTTREILDAIAGEYTAAQLARGKRLLTAMDLVKFAEREQRESLFDELDADFDALVVRRA